MKKREPIRSEIQISILQALKNAGVQNHMGEIMSYTDSQNGGGILVADPGSGAIITICTSGLGNRIASLIGGFYWSQRLGCDLKIFWDKSACCMCSHDDLFPGISPYIISKEELCGQIIQALQKAESVKTYSVEKLQEPLSSQSTIIYNSAEFYPYIDKNITAHALRKMEINKDVLQKAQTFISENKIDQLVTGLHIRKIDPPEERTNRFYLPVEFYTRIVSNNPDRKYFLCSDSKEVEEMFRPYQNIIQYKKEHYPTYDEENDITYRDKESVIESLVDILALSRTDIFGMSLLMSSFCQAANAYSSLPQLT